MTSANFRKERHAKKHLRDPRREEPRKIAIITYALFDGGWMPHFLTHYLEYTNADIFIVAAGFEPCLSSSHLDSGRVQTIRLP